MLGSKGHSPQAWVVMRSAQEWVIDNLKSGVRISNAALLRGWQALKLLSHHLLPPFPHMSRKPESDAEPRLKARHTNILCRQPRQLLLTAVPTVCLDVKVFNSQINFPFHSTFFEAFFPQETFRQKEKGSHPVCWVRPKPRAQFRSPTWRQEPTYSTPSLASSLDLCDGARRGAEAQYQIQALQHEMWTQLQGQTPVPFTDFLQFLFTHPVPTNWVQKQKDLYSFRHKHLQILT